MDAAIKSPPRAVSARVFREAKDSDLRWLAVCVGVAFALRLIFVIAATRPSYRVLNDAFFYHTIAESLVRGHGFSLISGAATAAWPPGYPFVLAGLYGVFGEH